MAPLEIAGNAFTLTSVHLARRNSVHTWWTGLVAVTLYGAMFFGVKLYADVVLQIFFFGTCVAGWWQWLHGGVGGGTLPVTRMSPGMRVAAFVAAFASALVFGHGFHVYTDAALPFADSYILGGSIVAQMLMIRRKLDHWWIWITVDIVAILVYAAKGLYLTSAVYAVLLVLCIQGVLDWRRILATQQATLAVAHPIASTAPRPGRVDAA